LTLSIRDIADKEAGVAMRRAKNATTVLRAGVVWAAVAGLPVTALAQVDCATIPAGPARTDCYIGLSRIERQKAEISAGVAQQQTDRAIYREVTGKPPKKKTRRVAPW
jgi:hypothetical protein